MKRICLCHDCLAMMMGLVICLLTAGCSSQKIPEGFPSKLVPFRVTLLHEGKPVEGAAVALVSETASGYYVVAYTGSDGVAEACRFTAFAFGDSPSEATASKRPGANWDPTPSRWRRMQRYFFHAVFCVSYIDLVRHPVHNLYLDQHSSINNLKSPYP
jgi:hypothetical protein